MDVDAVRAGVESPAPRTSKPLKLCFVAPSAYPVLSGDRSIQFVGGAQVQQCILAREFVRRGHSVSMISMDYGQPEGVVIDGITVYRMHAPDEGLPVVRFIHPRLTSVWRAMKRANADVYYQRAAGALTAYVTAFARRHRCTCVYAAASDRDFLPDLPNVALARDRALFRWGVRRASLVVAQTQHQARQCESTFGRTPVLIRSCYAHQGAPAAQSGPVIWVANLLPVKRAHLFVELARRLPNIGFKLVGGSDARRLEEIKALATGMPNLEFTGHVPFADVEQQFDGASVLVNTSTNEGFPNTFLQAWSRGMPTVSFFDPQAKVDGHTAGVVVGSIDEMAAQLAALHADARLWRQQSDVVRRYFDETFDVARAVDQYEHAFAMTRLS